jgi:hypothetical protein
MYGSVRDSSFLDDNIGMEMQYSNGVRVSSCYFSGDGNRVASIVGDQIGIGHLGGGNPRMVLCQFQGLYTAIELSGDIAGGGNQGVNAEIHGPRIEACSWGIRSCEAGTGLYGGNANNANIGNIGTFVEINKNANGSDILPSRSNAIGSDIVWNDVTAMLTSTSVNALGHMSLGSTDNTAQLNIRPDAATTDWLHGYDQGGTLRVRGHLKGFLTSRVTAAPVVGDLVNSEAVIGVLTSNTTLVFYARGSDGTLRSATLTLA